VVFRSNETFDWLPSSEQTAIFDWFETGDGNLIVVARAGTGKTSTIIRALNYAPEARILVCAFNKRIADELVSKITDPRAEAKTFHSIGYAAVRRNWNVKMAQGFERALDLAEKVCGGRVPDPIISLVAKLHTKGRELAPYTKTGDELADIAIQFECEPDESWWNDGYTPEYVCDRAAEAMDLAARVKPVVTGIDFADQIFLPLRNNWLRPNWDLVIVDEAQDMNFSQLEIGKRIARKRIVVVGDDRQAIYAFRGADSDSLNRLKVELNAKELGLKTTYRCGHAIVAKAQELVPDFVAGENNPAGEVIEGLGRSQMITEAENGDFVLSRINAPLVSIAMKFLRQGKRARIAGRDIGQNLVNLAQRLSKGAAADSIPEFVKRVSAWEDSQVAKLTAKMTRKNEDTISKKIEAVNDQAATLQVLAEDAITPYEVIERISSLFTDNGLGSAGFITCSSVHKAKGLEANRVYVLADTLRTYNQEELNIQYVAITRAKKVLVMVTPDPTPIEKPSSLEAEYATQAAIVKAGQQ
jgi:superfamily I DNA/RNA helicase